MQDRIPIVARKFDRNLRAAIYSKLKEVWMNSPSESKFDSFNSHHMEDAGGPDCKAVDQPSIRTGMSVLAARR